MLDLIAVALTGILPTLGMAIGAKSFWCMLGFKKVCIKR